MSINDLGLLPIPVKALGAPNRNTINNRVGVLNTHNALIEEGFAVLYIDGDLICDESKVMSGRTGEKVRCRARVRGVRLSLCSKETPLESSWRSVHSLQEFSVLVSHCLSHACCHACPGSGFAVVHHDSIRDSTMLFQSFDASTFLLMSMYHCVACALEV